MGRRHGGQPSPPSVSTTNAPRSTLGNGISLQGLVFLLPGSCSTERVKLELDGTREQRVTKIQGAWAQLFQKEWYNQGRQEAQKNHLPGGA